MSNTACSYSLLYLPNNNETTAPPEVEVITDESDTLSWAVGAPRPRKPVLSMNGYNCPCVLQKIGGQDASA